MTYSYRHIWLISYPILAGLLIQQLIGLTDTAFLGRVGEIELGASAIAGVFYIMIFMLGQGFSVGAQIIIARRNGEQNYQRIGPIVYQGIAFLLLTTIVIATLMFRFSPAVLSAIISSPAVCQAALDYLQPRIFGFFFAFVIVMFRAFYIGITNTKILTLNALLMLFVNVGLDYILIFGKLGFPAMGIRGAAVASVISEAVSALFFIVYTFYKTDWKKYGFNLPELWNTSLLQKILNISVWTMLQSVVSLGTWLMFMLAVEHLGERELAISNVLRSISSLPFMVVGALYGSANAVTSNLIGMEKNKEIKATARRIIVLGYAIGTAMELLMAFFPIAIMRIYTNNQILIDAAVPAYFVSLTTYFTLVPGFILLGVVSGTGRTKEAMVMELLALAAYVINVWYVVIYLRADIALCWTCEHSYNILLTIFTYYYLRKRHWCGSPAQTSLS